MVPGIGLADGGGVAADVKEIAGSKARSAAEEEAAKLQAELQHRLDQQSAELDTAQQQVCKGCEGVYSDQGIIGRCLLVCQTPASGRQFVEQMLVPFNLACATYSKAPSTGTPAGSDSHASDL